MTYVPPKYPGEIPTENDLFPWFDDKHYVSVEKFTAIIKELRAALIELGTDPAGAYDTVKAFLTALNTDKITGAQVPENETDPSVDASLKGITLAQVRDHPAVFPAGIIAMWSGTLATIPDGWALCDGGGGRPDLRSKFVMGAAAGVDPGGIGGTTTHKHGKGTYAVENHRHPVSIRTGGPSRTDTICEENPYTEAGSDDHTHLTAGNTGYKTPSLSGSSEEKNHLPPYYKVAFIIKT